MIIEGEAVINKRLTETYGLTPEGKPLFRVVQNLNLTEKRKGTFAKCYGKIFLGEYTGVMERPKYTYISEGHWILEQWQNYSAVPIESIESKGGYEALYVFEYEDDKGQRQPLPVEWWVIELIVKTVQDQLQKHFYPKYSEDEEKKKSEKNIKEYEQILEHEAPLLAYGGGVSYSGKKFEDEYAQRGNDRVGVDSFNAGNPVNGNSAGV